MDRSLERKRMKTMSKQNVECPEKPGYACPRLVQGFDCLKDKDYEAYVEMCGKPKVDLAKEPLKCRFCGGDLGCVEEDLKLDAVCRSCLKCGYQWAKEYWGWLHAKEVTTGKIQIYRKDCPLCLGIFNRPDIEGKTVEYLDWDYSGVVSNDDCGHSFRVNKGVITLI